TFELTTYVKGDGAPGGDYAITIEWIPPRPPPPHRPKQIGDRLKGRYSDPQRSKISYSVEKDKDNNVPPIELNLPDPELSARRSDATCRCRAGPQPAPDGLVPGRRLPSAARLLRPGSPRCSCRGGGAKSAGRPDRPAQPALSLHGARRNGRVAVR